MNKAVINKEFEDKFNSFRVAHVNISYSREEIKQLLATMLLPISNAYMGAYIKIGMIIHKKERYAFGRMDISCSSLFKAIEDAKKATYKYVHKESLKPISKDWYINTLQNNPEWLPDIAKYLVSTGNYQVLEKSWKEVQ